jgi:hypothetical protein
VTGDQIEHRGASVDTEPCATGSPGGHREVLWENRVIFEVQVQAGGEFFAAAGVISESKK